MSLMSMGIASVFRLCGGEKVRRYFCREIGKSRKRGKKEGALSETQ